MPEITRTKTWWDRWFIGLARYIASASKDPSTGVGAVIIRADRTPVSWGYNGFPRGVRDTLERYEDRATKYLMICHSERNALLEARQDLRGCTLYTTFVPCATCAGMIIQAGITRVVTIPTPPERKERWAKDIAVTETMFQEAEVELTYLQEDA
jgi:dCMP deaminase